MTRQVQTSGLSEPSKKNNNKEPVDNGLMRFLCKVEAYIVKISLSCAMLIFTILCFIYTDLPSRKQRGIFAKNSSYLHSSWMAWRGTASRKLLWLRHGREGLLQRGSLQKASIVSVIENLSLPISVIWLPTAGKTGSFLWVCFIN